MRVKKMRQLTFGEWMQMMLLAGEVERQYGSDLADLFRRVAGGDDSALVPCVDALIEVGRPELAERLKTAVSE